MIKADEARREGSCFTRALWDEELFLLMGRDESAPGAIEWWAKDRLARGKNVVTDEEIVEAFILAKRMREEHARIRGVLADQRRAAR